MSPQSAVEFCAPIAIAVLAHFTWQATLIGLVLLLVRSVFQVHSAFSRYALSLVALFAMALAPLATGVYLCCNPAALPVGAMAAIPLPSAAPVDLATPRDSLSVTSLADWAKYIYGQGMHWLLRYGTPILFCWFGGMALLAGRLLAAAWFCWRLRRGRSPLPPQLEGRVRQLCAGLGIRYRVLVAVSTRVTQAVAFGVFRPVVLIPASWIARMSPASLEAVIAHELAHIRRWDLWVNILQRWMETVFFFHPGVWWLSRRIRQEREFCCDSLAIRVTGNPLVYAETLSDVARAQLRRESEFQFGTTFVGGKKMFLLQRVNQLLQPIDTRRSFRFLPLLIAASLIAPAVIGICSLAEGTATAAPAAAMLQDQKSDQDSSEAAALYQILLQQSGEADDEAAQQWYQLVLSQLADPQERAVQLQKVDLLLAQQPDRRPGEVIEAVLALQTHQEDAAEKPELLALLELARQQPGDDSPKAALQSLQLARLLQDDDRHFSLRRLATTESSPEELKKTIAALQQKQEQISQQIAELRSRLENQRRSAEDSADQQARAALRLSRLFQEQADADAARHALLFFRENNPPQGRSDKVDDALLKLKEEIQRLREEVERMKEDREDDSGEQSLWLVPHQKNELLQVEVELVESPQLEAHLELLPGSTQPEAGQAIEAHIELTPRQIQQIELHPTIKTHLQLVPHLHPRPHTHPRPHPPRQPEHESGAPHQQHEHQLLLEHSAPVADPDAPDSQRWLVWDVATSASEVAGDTPAELWGFTVLPATVDVTTPTWQGVVEKPTPDDR